MIFKLYRINILKYKILTILFIVSIIAFYSISNSSSPTPTALKSPSSAEQKSVEQVDLQKAFVISYTSDQKAYLEDCGCRSKLQGGMAKKKTLLDEWKKQNKSFVLVDGGGFVSYPNDQGKLKTEYFLRGLSLLNYDAINVSQRDLQYGADFIKQMMEKFKLNFISANIIDKKDNKVIFPTHKILELKEQMGNRTIKVGVIGVTKSLPISDYMKSKYADKLGEFTLLDPVKTTNDAIKEIREKCDFIVVLAYISMSSAKSFIEQINNVDLVIVGFEATYMPIPQNILGTKVVSIGYQGRYLGEVKFAMDENKKVTQVIGKQYPLDQSISDNLEILKLIAEYKTASQKVVATYVSSVYQNMFVGDRGCQTCHTNEYERWKTTKHSNAFDTLVKKNNQFDPDCLECHTTGYNQYNGFRSFKTTPGMINVQCEVCHGPLSLHAREEYLVKAKKLDKGTAKFPTINEALCIKCHNPDHDDDFNYERDLKLIDHKNLATTQPTPTNVSSQSQ